MGNSLKMRWMGPIPLFCKACTRRSIGFLPELSGTNPSLRSICEAASTHLQFMPLVTFCHFAWDPVFIWQEKWWNNYMDLVANELLLCCHYVWFSIDYSGWRLLRIISSQDHFSSHHPIIHNEKILLNVKITLSKHPWWTLPSTLVQFINCPFCRHRRKERLGGTHIILQATCRSRALSRPFHGPSGHSHWAWD